MLKRIHHPEMHSIQTIVDTAFRRALTALNEFNEISFVHLKSFIMFYDATRLYLANLGVQTVTRDASKLLEQRAEILREMAMVKAEIQLLGDAELDDYEDRLFFDRERGGDVRLLQLDDEGSSVTETSASQKVFMPPDLREPTEEQRLRRHERKNSAQRKENDFGVNVSDAMVFANGCRHTDGIDGYFASEKILRKRWASMRRHKEPLDGELHLDIDLIEDLFESIGMELSDHDAASCLSDTPRNQANMYQCEDILKWFHHFTHVSKIVYPTWISCFTSIRSTFTKISDAVLSFVNVANYQNKLLQGQDYLRIYNRLINRLEIPLHASDLTVNNVSDSSKLNFSFTFNHKDDRSAIPHSAKPMSATFGSSKLPSPGELKRGQSSSRSLFNAGSLMKSLSVRSAVEAESIRRSKYPCYVHLQFTSNADGTHAATLLCDDSNRLLKPLKDILAADVLRHFNQMHYLANQKHTSELEKYRSVTWFVVSTSRSCPSQGMEIALQTNLNFFRSIPLEFRASLYSVVEGGIFFAHSDDILEADTSHQVIFVALLHVEDIWGSIEEKLPENFFISRVLKNVDLNILLRDTLYETFLESKEYFDYISRLFGPQEDEISEEAMNPLRFAKSCRQTKRDIEERLNKVKDTTTEEIKVALESRGYSSSGTRHELCDRYESVLRRELGLVGFGEMSIFGKRVCSEIFRRYDLDMDGALSFHEMNKLLSDLKRHTIYDSQEFRAIIDRHGFLTDSNGNLTLNGFLAYFQIFGHLSESADELGVGSLDDLLQGRIYGTVELHDGYISSLLSICEQQSYAQHRLKAFVLFMSNIKDFQFLCDYDKISEIFQWLNDPGWETALSSPGWLARALYFFEESLADEDNGIIRSLRKTSNDSFNDYYYFVDKFTDLCQSEVRPYSELSIDERLKLKDRILDILPPLSVPTVTDVL